MNNLKKQRAERLISEAEKRVARNPTDLQYKYELGQQLLAAGRFREAIPRLQDARRSPNVRLKAMNLLGQCYLGNGMLDMAEKQFTEAKNEILTMDDTKKEITYRLGLVYEKMGKTESSLECMKEIYEADYGYMDVAQRVERPTGSNLALWMRPTPSCRLWPASSRARPSRSSSCGSANSSHWPGWRLRRMRKAPRDFPMRRPVFRLLKPSWRRSGGVRGRSCG